MSRKDSTLDQIDDRFRYRAGSAHMRFDEDRVMLFLAGIPLLSHVSAHGVKATLDLGSVAAAWRTFVFGCRPAPSDNSDCVFQFKIHAFALRPAPPVQASMP